MSLIVVRLKVARSIAATELFVSYRWRPNIYLISFFFIAGFWSQTLNFSAIKIFNRGSLASGRCDQSLSPRLVNEQRLVAEVGR